MPDEHTTPCGIERRSVGGRRGVARHHARGGRGTVRFERALLIILSRARGGPRAQAHGRALRHPTTRGGSAPPAPRPPSAS